MGMDTGVVTVWDLQRGVVAFKLGKGLELPPVTDVAFSADGRSLFSSSLEKDLLEWDLEVQFMPKRILWRLRFLPLHMPYP